MKKAIKRFFEVVQSYSLEERVVSLIALIVLFFVLSNSVISWIRGSKMLFDKGSLTIGIFADRPVLLNPLYTDLSDSNRILTNLLFSGLVKYDPVEKQFVPDLADFKISEDKKEYVFELKDGVKWHDGVDLTIDDVIFTYELIRSEGFQNPVLKANFEGVDFEKVGDKGIKFMFESPNSFAITNFGVGILPKHLLEDVSILDLPSHLFNFKPIGSGQYKLSDNVEFYSDGRERVNLEFFEDYYGEKPKIVNLKFLIYPDQQMLFKNIEFLDLIPKVPYEMVGSVENSDFVFENYELPQYTAVFFNTTKGALSDRKVRLALLKSLNKEQLITDLGNKVRVDTPLLELQQKDWIFKANVEEASGALFDAGYVFEKDKSGNIVEGQIYRKGKDGKELEFTLIARKFAENSLVFVEYAKTIDFLVESWKKVGVKLNVLYVDEFEFADILKYRDYEMVLAGQNLGYNLDTFSYWHSSQIGEGGFNFSLYKSFAVDQFIEKVRLSFDQKERENRLNQIAKVISEDVPAVFLYRPKNFLLRKKMLQNVNLKNWAYVSDLFATIEDWCISCVEEFNQVVNDDVIVENENDNQ